VERLIVKPARHALFQAHVTPEKLLQHVDLDAVLAAPENQDKSPEAIADAIIDTIAAATPWSVIIPGFGQILDAVEAKAVKALVHAILLASVKKKRVEVSAPSDPPTAA